MSRRHLSHSSIDVLGRCGEQYRLKYQAGAPQGTSWAAIAGSAIHKVTEIFDIEGNLNPSDEAVQDEFDIALQDQVDESMSRYKIESEDKIKSTGRVSKEWPLKRNRSYWEKNGAAHIVRYLAWRRANPSWQLWTTPDGKLAVELEIDVEVNGQQFLGYIDRVFTFGGELVITDLKSGARKPDSAIQLAEYKYGIYKTYGVTARFGTYFMTEKGVPLLIEDLARFPIEWTEKRIARAASTVARAAFIESPGGHCNFCDVKPYCRVFGQPGDVLPYQEEEEDEAA